jgi:ribosomal protein L12E/L44/L45/RPP1/RPP2
MGEASQTATVDLSDPLAGLSNDGNQAQSADDLLSQLAGDEIDRLLAESGEEPVAEAEAPSARETPPPTDPAPAEQAKKTPLEQEMDLDAAVNAAALERVEIRESEHLDSDVSPQIDLGEPARRLPLFLRPLEWLSAPLDPWPDQFRDLLGKAAILTLVNALAVIAYVVFVRHHHH